MSRVQKAVIFFILGLTYQFIGGVVSANIDSEGCVTKSGVARWEVHQKFEFPAGSGQWHHYEGSPFRCSGNSGPIATHHGSYSCHSCTQPCHNTASYGPCTKNCGDNGVRSYKDTCSGQVHTQACNRVACTPPACGTRNKTYAASVENYPAGSIWCSSGTGGYFNYGANDTYFPTAGGSTITWKCTGENGAVVNCSADRESGDAACGTRNTTYTAATTDYPSGSTWCNPGSLHSRDWSGGQAYSFPNKRGTISWTCIGEGGGTDIACHASRLDDGNHVDPYCTGLRPVGAIMCSGDDMGVTENTQWEEVANCTNTRKCEYTMTGGTNGNPTCGPASSNTVGYENAGEVESAGLCGDGSALSEWSGNSDNFSDITDNGADNAWTWKCSKGGNTIECSALRKGVCGPGSTVAMLKHGHSKFSFKNIFLSNVYAENSTPPYLRKEDACNSGAFNSVELGTKNGHDVLTWKCGTGGYDKHVGDFFSSNRDSGALVSADGYAPQSGGVNCECRPSYVYNCVGTNTYEGSCDNNCGGTRQKIRQAVQMDEHCFPNEVKILDDAEYSILSGGDHCTNEMVPCPPCGTQDSEGGIFHETNF